MKKSPRRPRDRSFLEIAFLAGAGGLLAVCASIGMPLWDVAHGRPWNPAFFFFGLWGIAALAGCAASVHTWLQSGDPPEKPPRGGIPVKPFEVIEGGAAAQPRDDTERKAA